MSVKHPFQTDKLSIVEFKLLKGQIDTSEEFDVKKIKGYQLQNSLELRFNIEDKLVKSDFTIEIQTESNGSNISESKGIFHLVFIYKVENLEELAIPDKNDIIQLDSTLGNALSSITYSTARGILLTRLQGTTLQNFVLPIINPSTLLK